MFLHKGVPDLSWSRSQHGHCQQPPSQGCPPTPPPPVQWEQRAQCSLSTQHRAQLVSSTLGKAKHLWSQQSCSHRMAQDQTCPIIKSSETGALSANKNPSFFIQNDFFNPCPLAHLTIYWPYEITWGHINLFLVIWFSSQINAEGGKLNKELFKKRKEKCSSPTVRYLPLSLQSGLTTQGCAISCRKDGRAETSMFPWIEQK